MRLFWQLPHLERVFVTKQMLESARGRPGNACGHWQGENAASRRTAGEWLRRRQRRSLTPTPQPPQEAPETLHRRVHLRGGGRGEGRAHAVRGAVVRREEAAAGHLRGGQGRAGRLQGSAAAAFSRSSVRTSRTRAWTACVETSSSESGTPSRRSQMNMPAAAAAEGMAGGLQSSSWNTGCLACPSQPSSESPSSAHAPASGGAYSTRSSPVPGAPGGASERRWRSMAPTRAAHCER